MTDDADRKPLERLPLRMNGDFALETMLEVLQRHRPDSLEDAIRLLEGADPTSRAKAERAMRTAWDVYGHNDRKPWT